MYLHSISNIKASQALRGQNIENPKLNSPKVRRNQFPKKIN